MLVHDRNPESMRTVPRVCAAGRDSVPGIRGIRGIEFSFAFFSKNRPRAEKWLEIKCFGYLEATFSDAEIFPVFLIFQPPQHRPHVELRKPGSELGDPGFSFFIGGRDAGSGTGVRSLGSGVEGLRFPNPGTI